MVSDKVYRGLLVINDNCIHTAEDYALYRWPNAYHKASIRGGMDTIMRYARASLKRLTEGGYVKRNGVYEVYELTAQGQAAMHERFSAIREAIQPRLVPNVSASPGDVSAKT